MVELGQLEEHWQEFEKRKVRVVVVSVEDIDKAKATQEDFPHLTVVSDADKQMTRTLDVLHRHSAPDASDTAAPTTFLVDGKGIVRWTFRPDRVFTRISPSELLTTIDRELPDN